MDLRDRRAVSTGRLTGARLRTRGEDDRPGPATVQPVLALVARALPEVRGTQRTRGSDIDSPVDALPVTAPRGRAGERPNQ